jgi:chorismate mutase/prephenate dehydratase
MTKNLIVAFQGEKGAYSEIAAESYFDKSIKTLPSYSFEEVFIKVRRGVARRGVIPIENTLYGSVFENYDLLLKYHVSVIAELNLQINHYLISSERHSLSKLKKIYSHPQAIGQCSKFLNGLKVEIVPSYDTAGSALLSMRNVDEPTAAITSYRAAKIYNMKILKKNIQNNKVNYTRFFVISKKKSDEEPKHPKSTLSFDLKSIPGALHKALGVFANAEIDLSMIESRPIPHKPFQYTFYIDITGSLNDKKIKTALKKLSELTVTIRRIGTYEKGKTYKS